MDLRFPLILASSSPRRKVLLESTGLKFDVISRPADENFSVDIEPQELALNIAENKLQSYKDLSDSHIVICADTIVVIDGQILGKPDNAYNALEMLKMLNGKKHNVITGVALAYPEGKKSFHETTTITLYTLEIKELQYYINHFEPFDKAGAYGIQEWFGHIAVKKIEGSYTNVVGLPVSKLYQRLKSLSA